MLPPRHPREARPSRRRLVASFAVCALALAACARSTPAPPPERAAATELRFVEDGVRGRDDARLQHGAGATLAEVSHPVLTAVRRARPTVDCGGAAATLSSPCRLAVPASLPAAPATVLAWTPGGTENVHRAPHGDATAATKRTGDAAPQHGGVRPPLAARIVPPGKGATAPGQYTVLEAQGADVLQVPSLAERTVETRYFVVPADAVLRLSFGVEEPAWPIDSAPVYFRVVAEREDGATQDMLRRILDPARREQDRRWFDADVDLSDLAGAHVKLRFLSEPAESGDTRPSLPVWGDPRVLTRETGAPRPSIVLISLDTLRAKSMSTYGHGVDTTPLITALAQRGVLFENAFTTFSNTLPSHMSMLTGLLPAEHGVRLPSDVLDPKYATLAATLRGAGYATAAFTEDALLDGRRGFKRGFSTYFENTSIEGGAGDAAGTFGRALEWAGRHADERFFLFVHTYEVHAPYEPREAYRGLFEDGAGRDLGGALRTYEQEIRYLDDQLARLLDGLAQVVPERELLIVLTSDHGEEFWEHGSIFHTQLFDEVMRVPLVLVWPGIIPPGVRVAAPVSLVDLLPTITALAGVPLDNDVDGTSLVPLLATEPTARASDVVFGESPPLAPLLEQRFVARGAKAKCILAESPEHDVCYDLVDDPEEMRPRSPRDGAELSRVYTRAVDYRTRAQATRVKASEAKGAQPQPAPVTDPQIERKMRALGYVQ